MVIGSFIAKAFKLQYFLTVLLFEMCFSLKLNVSNIRDKEKFANLTLACLAEEFAWDGILLFKTVSFSFKAHSFFLHTLNSLANSLDRLDNWPTVTACLLIGLSTDTVDLEVIQVLRSGDIKRRTIHGVTKKVLIVPNQEQLPNGFHTLCEGQCVHLHVQMSALFLQGGAWMGVCLPEVQSFFNYYRYSGIHVTQKSMFNCNCQSIMQIQIDVLDVKCLSSAITLEGTYLLLICFCHYKLRINIVLFLAKNGIKIREGVFISFMGKRT